MAEIKVPDHHLIYVWAKHESGTCFPVEIISRSAARMRDFGREFAVSFHGTVTGIEDVDGQTFVNFATPADAPGFVPVHRAIEAVEESLRTQSAGDHPTD